MPLPTILVGRSDADFALSDFFDPDAFSFRTDRSENTSGQHDRNSALHDDLRLPGVSLDDVFGRFGGPTFDAPGASNGQTIAALIRDILSGLRDTDDKDATLPTLSVNPDSAAVSVDNPNLTISVIWNQAIIEAVIEDSPGPTVASRAYAILHTAMFEAWAAYDEDAVGTAFGDLLQQDPALNTDANKREAMSYAAYTAAVDLFPDKTAAFDTLLETELGYTLPIPGATLSDAGEVGLLAGKGVVQMRQNDGSNAQGAYADTTGYMPVNSDPDSIVDIAKWTPTRVPIDSPDPTTLQSFLTPQWGEVTPFAISDIDDIRPPAPEPFFVDGIEATLDLHGGTVTIHGLSEDATRRDFRDLRDWLRDTYRGTDDFADVRTFIREAREQLRTDEAPDQGLTLEVTKDLIGPVINAGFIEQTEEVIDFSANLTDEQKIIAEFWEDGKGTAFPPGTWMIFAEWVSTHDGNSLDEDAQLFFAMSNAMLDAGIATWEAKVFYDYVRPVNAVRDLAKIGLVGDENGMIEAFTFENGVQMIPGTEFNTYQNPLGDPSPPFAEYTSGHSSFSAAGAEVLALFTGDDHFGAEITADFFLFKDTDPSSPVTLSWDTFKEAADEAGISRLYGGIHFEQGDVYGRELGEEIGEDVYETAQSYIDGSSDTFFFTDLNAVA